MRENILLFLTTWMDLEHILLSEISQAKESRTPLVCGMKNKFFISIISTNSSPMVWVLSSPLTYKKIKSQK